ncbi:ABC transporter ATP-binding protein [Thermosulfurimonas marina]|uniref:ABC transporter ATP-binding protein n=1 Tax=Thermosulfurimonas marina TaxID=2047767 RepID=A0A6H1WQL3_9BACT|nr:ABC transporter ATP-binding protein [Thermosulfurimonas marina]QJA05444.1 ABC transporter ATP-binding protein [Thermosulfurimonas marina]
MLEVRDLSARAGSFFLERVSFALDRGQTLAIVGPTGAGKTLLLETLLGLRPRLAGTIRVEERRVEGLPVEQRRLAYLPQDLALFPHLSVEENIFYGPRVSQRRPPPEMEEILEVLGLRDLLHRKVDGLSGGERQRVALARALAAGARVLLLDEPLSALHEALRRELWLLLREMQQRYGLTYLLVTHDLEEAFFLGHRVGVLMGGRLLREGPAEEIWRDPRHPEVARFLGVRNLFCGVLQRKDQRLFVEVPGLGSLTIWGRKGPHEGEIMIGIRPEEIIFLREERLKKEQENLFRVRVKDLFSVRESWWVVLEAERGARLEARLPDFALHKLGLFPGCKALIILPAEKLLLLRPL